LQEFNPEDRQDPQIPEKSFIKSLNPFAYVIIVLGIIFFLYQFIGGALALLAGVDIEGKNVKMARVVLAFGQYMFILAPAIFFARLQSHDIKKTFRLNAPHPYLIFLSILGIILIQPFLQGYMVVQDYVLNNLPFLRETFKQVKDLFDTLESAGLKIVSAHSVFEFIVVVFVICITPAICEEILFRGFVLKNMQRISRPGIAIFMSGFLFAVYHFQPFNIIPLIILGCFLGYAVYCSNSIYTGMICHFLNNFFATFFLYKYGKEEVQPPHLTNSESTDVLIAAAVSFVIFLGVMYIIYRLRVRVQPEEDWQQA
jgi:membrane protease YdiL (CAAX protease family)